MKRLTIYFAIVLFVLVSNTSMAQSSKLKMELSYNVSAPLGSFKNDFISNTSFRGVTGEVSYRFNPKFSLGLHSGSQSYYQKYGRQLYKLQEGQTVSAVVTNTFDVTPLILRGTYFPTGGSITRIQPFISAGAGLGLVTYGQYLGEFGGTKTSTPLAIQAGAGIQVPLGKKTSPTSFKLGTTYNYINYKKNDLSGISSIGVNAGIVFNLR
jgi:hypothetical protein